MSVDNDDKGKTPELKIRGQAEAERRKGKGDEEERKPVRLTAVNALIQVSPKSQGTSADSEHGDLAKRESELKERALRNKVVRTRKTSVAAPASGST